jgi:carboxypeptidase Q
MARLARTLVPLGIAVVFPAFTLFAQPPTAPPNQPTAEDVIKKVEKAEAQAKLKSSDPVERIKEESDKRSKVMETLSYLTDVIGPRLTGSPQLKRANEWTRDRLQSWGLSDAHLEPWGPFGRGWTLQRFSAQVVEPQCIPLIAFPKAWSPGTGGVLSAEVIHFDVKTVADFDRYKGKVKGLIVLNGPALEVPAHFEALATRLTDSELLELANAPAPAARKNASPPRTPPVVATGGSTSAPAPPRRRGMTPEQRAQLELSAKALKFLADEGAALVVDPSRQGDGGTLFVAAASVPGVSPLPTPGAATKRVSAWDKDAPKIPPQIVLSKEHYNRLVRMLKQGEHLKLEIDLDVRFHDDDPMVANTVAEIPGTDLKDEVVMLGGHMDSWHSGTGATDNAAGVAVAMEAVRILKALDLKPRRTVRIALWTGEEQGLHGSKAYVLKHFGKTPPSLNRPRPTGDTTKASDEPKSSNEPKETPTPEFEKFSAYFNLDNGTGKVRGVYLQGNDAVQPIFRSWLQPFRDSGAMTLTLANTEGTDHLSFDGIGLPGFQFIQDVVEYNSRTHHSNQDLYDRIQADDLKQAAAVMAAFVYNTANRDEKLPRKPSTR